MTIELKYDLGEELRKGPKGTVYRASHRFLGRTYALRVLHPELSLQGEAGQRIRAAIRQHAELIHPNIGRIIDADLDCERPYLVMDYYENGTLSERASSRRISPAGIVADILLVLNALVYAHSRGVLHKDVKPATVLYDALDIPHLVDFSLDLLEPAGPGGKKLLGSGVRELAYRSPELFRNPDAHTELTDIYGLGVMLYELLAGELPGREAPVLSEVAEVPFEVDEMYVRLTGRFDPFRSSEHALRWALSSPEIVNFIAVSTVLGPLFKEVFRSRPATVRPAASQVGAAATELHAERRGAEEFSKRPASQRITVEVEASLLEVESPAEPKPEPWELEEPVVVDEDLDETAPRPIVPETEVEPVEPEGPSAIEPVAAKEPVEPPPSASAELDRKAVSEKEAKPAAAKSRSDVLARLAKLKREFE